MSNLQSSRLHKPPQVQTSMHEKPGGTFGKKAAIRWKSIKKKWHIILAMMIGLVILRIFTQQQSALNKKQLAIEKRLDDLLAATETASELKNAVVRQSDLNERLRPIENHLKMITTSDDSNLTPLGRKDDSRYIRSSRKDFASFSAGASIIEPLTSPTWTHHRKIRSSKLPFYKTTEKITGSPPVTVLISDLSLGTCWPFHGTTGQVAIRLSRAIWIDGITIGHVSKSLAYDIQTAPKEFELWGLDNRSQDKRGTLILTGTYSISGSTNYQEFSVLPQKKQLFSEVVLKVKSNHGNADLTCVYRIQVHGEVGSMPDKYNFGYFMPT